jgi:hypothetical protein
MHIPSLPANIFTAAASQALSGLASRATSGPKTFEADLDSGNIAGAQSFLSTLQQKLSLGAVGGTGTAISAQIAQVSNDLTAGNLTAARSDYSHVQSALAQQHHAQASSNSTTQAASAAGSSLAALASYNASQEGAFNSAVNLSMPGNSPSLSINM